MAHKLICNLEAKLTQHSDESVHLIIEDDNNVILRIDIKTKNLIKLIQENYVHCGITYLEEFWKK